MLERILQSKLSNTIRIFLDFVGKGTSHVIHEVSVAVSALTYSKFIKSLECLKNRVVSDDIHSTVLSVEVVSWSWLDGILAVEDFDVITCLN